MCRRRCRQHGTASSSLAYIVGGVRVIGFDNERGKGDHRHDGGVETPYRFQGVEQLVAGFKAAVQAWRTAHGRG